MSTISTLLDAGVLKPAFEASPKSYTVQKSFDLTALAAVLANADVVQLFTIPAKTLIKQCVLEVTTAGTKDATSFTIQPRLDTTALAPALSAVATGIECASAAEAPTVQAAAGVLNLVVACAGGNATVTANPKIKVTLELINCA